MTDSQLPSDIEEALKPLIEKYLNTPCHICKDPGGYYSILTGTMFSKEVAMDWFSMDSHLPAFVFRFECRVCGAQVAPPEAEGSFWGFGVLRSKI